MTGEVPARQINLARDSATVFAVQGGDLHIHERIGTHQIDELSFDAHSPPVDDQPSRLLNAGNRVVRFTGRADEIAELAAWRDATAAVAVRLVHGGAGQGKTRLAHRFAELSRAAGWVALRARHSRDVAVHPVEVRAGDALATYGRVLVLVDYAERWPLSDLMALLLDRRLHSGPTLRVLLLARPVGNWWHALTHRLSQTLGVHADSVELAPLGATHTHSRHVYQVASACFAEVLGIPDPGRAVPELEGSVLTIHMAALAGVLAARHGDVLPTDPGHLSAYLLARERSHWQSMYDNERRIESSPLVMGRAVYLAALIRSVDYGTAVAALRATAVAEDATTAGRVLDDHAMCYPPQDPAAALEPLYPDRLAEDFVALQTPGHTVNGFRSDPWAADAFAASIAAGWRNAVTALPLLVEAARRWPHLIDHQLLPLLRDQPELAVQAGTTALAAIAAAPFVPLDVLEAIESVLPADPPPDLYAGIAALTERLAREVAGRTDDPLRAARLSQKLGWRLLEAGQVPEGIALLSAAVDAGRRLVSEDGAAHTAQLEGALRSLGRAYARVENWQSAATLLGEVVGLWASAGRPAAPAANEMAACLADLSLALWHQGEDGPSLATRDWAVAHLRRLIESDPRHRLMLVRTLVQQAEQLRDGARHHDSLDALDEAIRLLRDLANDRNAVLEVEFATTLLGRAKTLQSLGRLADAQRSVVGAVGVFRRLAARNISFDQDLARTLLVEAEILGALHRWTEAIDAHEQAIAIRRRLSHINSERYSLDLAQALITFGRLCRDAGQRLQDALRNLVEGMTILQAIRPDSEIRRKLLNLARSIAADLLDASGYHDDAEAMRRATRTSQTTTAQHRPASQSPMELGPELSYLANYILGLPPRKASEHLEKLSPHEAAAVLAGANVQDWWLDATMRMLPGDRALEVMTWLIRRGTPLIPAAIVRLVWKRLRALPSNDIAKVLGHAAPKTAAIILNRGGWEEKASEVLALLDEDHAREISRLIRLTRYAPDY